MSVGAGSIKRAAKAVKSDVVTNSTEEVKAVVEKTDKAAVAEKSTAPKAEAPKTTKKPAAKKTTAKAETAKTEATKDETATAEVADNKAGSKPVAKKTTKTTTKTTKPTKTTKTAAPKAEAKKSAYNSDYEAYGVGQQLPVHLM